MSTSSAESEVIQQRMQQVRTNLGMEVRDLVVNARAMTDWRHYWRGHPGLCSAGAAVLGYLLVPARRVAQSDMKRMTEDVTRAQAAARPKSPAPPGLARRLLGEIAGLAVGFAVKRGLKVVEDSLTNANSGAPSASPEPPPERAKPKRRSP